jgi:hypothetical protein
LCACYHSRKGANDRHGYACDIGDDGFLRTNIGSKKLRNRVLRVAKAQNDRMRVVVYVPALFWQSAAKAEVEEGRSIGGGKGRRLI